MKPREKRQDLTDHRGGGSSRGPLGLIAAVLVVALLVYWVSDARPPQETDWEAERARMVLRQIEAREVRNPRVLQSMRTVPRHLFVPEAYRHRAYEDGALPIGSRQTISQPYIVAVMTELLDPKPNDKVLEIGTGSGYQAAVLSGLVEKLYTIEILPELAERARRTLAELGYDNVVVITGDGYQGLSKEAPFDGIIVTAAPEEIPQPLVEQLKPGGRLVIPVGRGDQDLRVLEKTNRGVRTKKVFKVRFVPMTGTPPEKD